MDKYEVLKHCFGHSRFRQGQEELVDAVLSGRDALGIMPTGGGNGWKRRASPHSCRR